MPSFYNLFCCKKDQGGVAGQPGPAFSILLLSRPTSPEIGFNDFLKEHQHQYRWENELAALPYGAALRTPLADGRD